MAKISKIEWTDATWNPWYGCTKVSEGCVNCYMDRWAKRTGRDPTIITRAKPATFTAPLKWKEPRLIFVCSLGDFFHEDIPHSWRRDAWEIMFDTPQHIYLLLTKRPQNIMDLRFHYSIMLLDNVWYGISAENQKRANERIPFLLQIPASRRFVSAEPLLEPLHLQLFLGRDMIHWVITGGESGPNARLCNLDWIRAVRDQCNAWDVPFFHKQHGGRRKINGSWGGRILDGRTWDEIPFSVASSGDPERSMMQDEDEP